MQTSSLKVLVAEDQPDMLDLLVRHVRARGVEVLAASDGDEALALAEAEGPDLVLLDVMMPGMSGWEVCKRIKGHTSGPLADAGVIMLTGIGENLNELTSPLFAADAWLDKPFELSALDARMDEVLAKHGKPSLVGAGRAAAKKSAQSPASKKASAAKKPAAKKAAAAKKPASKKASAAKKPAAKKAAAAKKPAAKKAAAAKKPAAKKGSAAKKPAAKKGSAAKKPAAKKASAAKKPAAKRASAKKA